MVVFTNVDVCFTYNFPVIPDALDKKNGGNSMAPGKSGWDPSEVPDELPSTTALLQCSTKVSMESARSGCLAYIYIFCACNVLLSSIYSYVHKFICISISPCVCTHTHIYIYIYMK